MRNKISPVKQFYFIETVIYLFKLLNGRIVSKVMNPKFVYFEREKFHTEQPLTRI